MNLKLGLTPGILIRIFRSSIHHYFYVSITVLLISLWGSLFLELLLRRRHIHAHPKRCLVVLRQIVSLIRDNLTPVPYGVHYVLLQILSPLSHTKLCWGLSLGPFCELFKLLFGHCDVFLLWLPWKSELLLGWIWPAWLWKWLHFLPHFHHCRQVAPLYMIISAFYALQDYVNDLTYLWAIQYSCLASLSTKSCLLCLTVDIIDRFLHSVCTKIAIEGKINMTYDPSEVHNHSLHSRIVSLFYVTVLFYCLYDLLHI